MSRRSTRSTRSKKAVIEEDEAPDEIRVDSEEIQRLRELHESASTFEVKKRKRVRVQADEEISDDVLAAVSSSQQASVSVVEETEQQSDPPQPTNPLERKIGNITVVAIEEDVNALSSYKTSKSARAFQEQVKDSIPRIRYSQFARQKRAAPAKQFKVC